MQTFTSLTAFTFPPNVATIGYFDGVHLGHQRLLAQLCQEAQTQGLASLVITFAQHPRSVLQQDYQPQAITTVTEKLALLEDSGVDYCVILPFTAQMATLSAADFMRHILHQKLHTRTLITGYDHRFGHDRIEGFAQYLRHGHALHMRLIQASRFEVGEVVVSSSAIRRFLSAGNIVQATDLLGRYYTLTGTVVHGQGIGHTLGYATANLSPLEDEKIIPANGVYAVVACLEGVPYGGMLNIGHRPTLGTDGARTIEVHFLGWQGDLYGRTLTVAFMRRLRFEQRFSGLQALQDQLRVDAMQATAIFDTARGQASFASLLPH